MAARLDVHHVGRDELREGPIVKGGLNLEYQIKDRPPDPPPMRRREAVAKHIVEVERQGDDTWIARVRGVAGAEFRAATRELALSGACALAWAEER